MNGIAHGCVKEADVVRAVAECEWPQELTDHVRVCACCLEAMLVASAMKHDPKDESVPDAVLVWRKMELRLKRERAEAALRPARLAERVTAGLLVLAASIALPLMIEQTSIAGWVAAGALAVVVGSAVSVYCVALSKH